MRELVLFDSTNEQSPPVDLREALLRGQAPDRGLYLAQDFPGPDLCGHRGVRRHAV